MIDTCMIMQVSSNHMPDMTHSACMYVCIGARLIQYAPTCLMLHVFEPGTITMHAFFNMHARVTCVQCSTIFC